MSSIVAMVTVAKDIQLRLKFRKACQKFGSLPLIAPNLVTNCNKIANTKEMDL